MGAMGFHGNAESTGEQLPGVLSRGKRGFDRDRCSHIYGGRNVEEIIKDDM